LNGCKKFSAPQRPVLQGFFHARLFIQPIDAERSGNG
jgi:hypothetical protein